MSTPTTSTVKPPTIISTPKSSVIDVISSSTPSPLTHHSGSTNKFVETSESLSKRKRKNRTAFTAHQIYELEKRFSAQKYLSPSDRDRISLELSLSTAQVITWFQNRRAKQKRDVEEMKNDLLASKSLCAQSSIDDQLSDCSFSNHQQQKQQSYSNNNSIENDCHSDSELSIDTSLS